MTDLIQFQGFSCVGSAEQIKTKNVWKLGKYYKILLEQRKKLFLKQVGTLTCSSSGDIQTVPGRYEVVPSTFTSPGYLELDSDVAGSK